MRHAWSALAFLSLVVIFLVIFAGQFVHALVQVTLPVAKSVPMRYSSPLLGRGGSILLPFDLPVHRTMLYVQKDAIYGVTIRGGAQATSEVVTPPFQIATPGYTDNPSRPPLVTPAGQLIYVGSTGLWMTDLVHNQPRQIATLGENQEVTSLVLSRDGSQLAWSSAPRDGQGEIQIFAGPIVSIPSSGSRKDFGSHSLPRGKVYPPNPNGSSGNALGSAKLVYQGAAGQCPCFRVFSFWSASDALEHDTLLLTDDHGDDGPVQHGLWVFPIDEGPSVRPALVINSDPPQGPLALSPDEAHLLYTTYEGNVPVPDDLPDTLATVDYANSLVVASLQSTVPYLANIHVVLPEQQEQGNSAQYHWVMSPGFSPDGQTLVYVEFSAHGQGSFTRTNALYMVQMRGSAASTRPTLLATTAAHYLALGSWWDAHTVTVCIDHGFYALDVQRGLLAPIIQTDGYAHEIAVISS